MRRIRSAGLWLACLLALTSQTITAAEFDRLQQDSLPSRSAARGLLIDLVQVPGRDRLIAVGEQGSILYSDDAGASWLNAKVPVSVLLTGVQMVSPSQGWAVGHDGVILQTRDGGLSWQLQAAGQQLLQAQQQALATALSRPEVLADRLLSDELQWRLDDVQAALDEGAMPILLDLLFIDERRGFALGAYGALFHTEDGGEHWHSIGHRLPNPDRLHLNALLLGRNGRLLLAGEAGLLLYSDDLGQQWQAAESPYDGSFFALTERDRFYLLGLRGHLFSSDDGLHWQAEAVPTDATLNGAVNAEAGLFLLGQGGLVLTRRDSGFSRLTPVPRYSFMAGLQQGERLLLAGEGGIHTISLDAQQGGER